MKSIPFRIAVLALAAACYHGQSARTYPPAITPAGAVLSLATAGTAAADIELLSLTDSGLMVVHDSAVTLVPFGNVRVLSAKVLPGGRWTPKSGEAPPEAVRTQLRLLSRFPQGMSSELLARVLGSYKQERVETLK